MVEFVVEIVFFDSSSDLFATEFTSSPSGKNGSTIGIDGNNVGRTTACFDFAFYAVVGEREVGGAVYGGIRSYSTDFFIISSTLRMGLL